MEEEGSREGNRLQTYGKVTEQEVLIRLNCTQSTAGEEREGEVLNFVFYYIKLIVSLNTDFLKARLFVHLMCTPQYPGQLFEIY